MFQRFERLFTIIKMPRHQCYAPFVIFLHSEPDPTFPTVPFPNPEEGKSALYLAQQTAEANDSIYILANDPDADRLAVAQRLPRYKLFF